MRGKQAIKAMVQRRFINQCCICGWNKGTCDAHHIISGINEISNILFLCPNDHRLTHQNIISQEELLTARKNMVAFPGLPDIAFK
jgi:predicted restriction endonuclease